LLGPLGMYGGPALVHPLLPGSPALNGGGGSCPPEDQRGVMRPQFGVCDAGAFESRGFTVMVASGDVQTATVYSEFGAPLAATVTSVDGTPVDGGQLNFSVAAGAAASAAFNPSATPAIVGATATVTATANSIQGSYAVTATTASTVQPAAFQLTNTPGYYAPWVAK
jgi:hypothetical protein